MRLGGLALGCALATSALVLVTFLASNLVLSVIGGTLPGGGKPVAEPPAAAVLLSAGQQTAQQQARCDRRTDRGRAAEQEKTRGADRCAGQRSGGLPHRP